MTDTVVPVNITLDRRADRLVINWSDGCVCRYPLSHLRAACPCADCRGGHEFMGRQHDPDSLFDLEPSRAYRVEALELIGNYALQFLWDDGHDAGIYTWDYLYRLCPAEDIDA
ncbi:MAG: DUF971 domain-containing protein [Anaerolineae bacterium]|jgi:DUF971 family protein|nr:DUF971 domain-containing protein [Anaerolineae bacterium]